MNWLFLSCRTILAKTYRIYRIFNNRSLSRTPIGASDMVIITGSVLLLAIILVAVMTFGSGYLRPTIVQNKTFPTLRSVECLPPSQTLYYAILGVFLVFALVIITATCVMAYLTRHVDSAYNESRYLAITAYITLEVLLIIIPLNYAAFSYGAVNIFATRAILFSLLVWFFICLLFLPKVYAIRKDDKYEQAHANRELGSRVLDVDSEDSFADTEDEDRFQEYFERRRRNVVAEGPSRQEIDPTEMQTGLMAEVIDDPQEYSGDASIWTGPRNRLSHMSTTPSL